jgi:hypothetical protein
MTELIIITSRIAILAQIDPHQFSNVEIHLAELLIRVSLVLLICCLQVLVYLLVNFLHVENMCYRILRDLDRAFDRYQVKSASGNITIHHIERSKSGGTVDRTVVLELDLWQDSVSYLEWSHLCSQHICEALVDYFDLPISLRVASCAKL